MDMDELGFFIFMEEQEREEKEKQEQEDNEDASILNNSEYQRKHD